MYSINKFFRHLVCSSSFTIMKGMYEIARVAGKTAKYLCLLYEKYCKIDLKIVSSGGRLCMCNKSVRPLCLSVSEMNSSNKIDLKIGNLKDGYVKIGSSGK